MKALAFDNASDAVTLDDTVVFENARQAILTLKKTFETWTVIGKAVVRARNIADVRGGGKTFMRLIEQQGLGRVISKSTASMLLRVMAELPKVTAWHETLTERQQIDWAAPMTIIRRCPVFNTPKTNDNEEEPKLTKGEQERLELAAALEKVDQLEKQLKLNDGDSFDPKTSSPREIADALVRALMPYAGKAKKVAKEMLALLEG